VAADDLMSEMDVTKVVSLLRVPAAGSLALRRKFLCVGLTSLLFQKQKLLSLINSQLVSLWFLIVHGGP